MLTIYSSYDELMNSINLMITLTQDAVLDELLLIRNGFECLIPKDISKSEYDEWKQDTISEKHLIVNGGGDYDFIITEDVGLLSIEVSANTTQITATAKEFKVDYCDISYLNVDCESFCASGAKITDLTIYNKVFNFQHFRISSSSSYIANIRNIPSTMVSFESEQLCNFNIANIDWSSPTIETITISMNHFWCWGEEWWEIIRKKTNNIKLGIDGIYENYYDTNKTNSKLFDPNENYSQILTRILKVLSIELCVDLFGWDCEGECGECSSPSEFLTQLENFTQNGETITELSEKEMKILRKLIYPATDDSDDYLNNMLLPAIQYIKNSKNTMAMGSILFQLLID